MTKSKTVEIAPVPGFFGHAIKPGQTLVWPNEVEDFAMQLNTAALGSSVTKGRSTLSVSVKDSKVALCTLTPETSEQWNLNHTFTAFDGPVTFSNEGVNEIHLTGFIDINEEEGEGMESDDDDEEGMVMDGTYSDSDEEDDEDEVMVFGDDGDDDSDDDEEDDEEEEEEGRFEVIEERLHGDAADKKKAEKKSPAKKDEPKKKEQPKKEETPVKTPAKDKTPEAKDEKKEKAAEKKKAVAEKVAEATAVTGKKRPAPSDGVDVPKKAKRVHKGVTIEETAVGKGQPVQRGKKVSILYRGRLENGKQFDANQNRKKPFSFRHGIGDVIKGMDIGIEGMRAGGKRTITIPGHLGYGRQGAPPSIPGNATLIFDIELFRIARAFPELPPSAQRRLARRSYAHVGTSLLWFLRLPALLADDSRRLENLVECCHVATDLEALREDLSDGRSVILTTGHVGLWELLPSLLASSLLPRHAQWIVFRPLHNPAVNALVDDLRDGKDRQLIPDKQCIRTLEQALMDSTQSSLVGLVADQRSSNPRLRACVRFLGQDTYLPTGPARLHLATKAPLWFTSLVLNEEPHGDARAENWRPFRLDLVPIRRGSSVEQDAEDITQAYADALEQVIRAQPAQYLWMHDLWSERAAALVTE
ncbi:hypothetical protein Poli38472_006187 [Pythium oligandrum]|uniref:peptidylprolyl isomerase n=1 Tax=Pythium oligandrum TaxID=41045 RepID=A0A8K1CT20_PYTOL|nr:hypothetical protein Poli38472_006187 [Pythium oligandrum]|eukprot:TMW68719.1 hypothetical protein Poli38472_006187 [Pythium oligandrum]